jgi:ADP-L-glycero-D-manno-heptose 6-epimerase
MILLTGTDGFIGGHFDRVLQRSDVIRVEQGNCFWFLNEWDGWHNVHLIIHNGAITSTTETDVQKVYRYNVDFTVRLMEKAIRYQIPIKYASSASVYGQFGNKTVNPLSQYALSKLQVDYFVRDNIDRFESVQGFRYFNVYGEGEEHKGDQASPVSKFRWQARAGGPVILFEDSDVYKRDFIWVGDVVDVVLNNKRGSGVFDLGTGDPISFEEIGRRIAERYSVGIEYVPMPENIKAQYQAWTRAHDTWGEKKFMTVEDYIK